MGRAIDENNDVYAFDWELEISSGHRSERVTVEQALAWLRRTRDVNMFSLFGRRCINRAIGALMKEQATLPDELRE